MTGAMATGVKTVEATGTSGFLEDMRRPYKAGQGILTRRIAYGTGVGFALWGARDLWVWLQGFGALKQSLLPGTPLSHFPFNGPAVSGSVLVAALVAAATWVFVAWYLKRPWLADLLIETETEMKKVSWPASDEAWGATKVVGATVLIFTGVLMVFDNAITWLMKLLTGLPL